MLQSRAVGADFLHFVGELRRRRFDLVVDLQGLLRSGFLAWASGAGRRVGFAEARELTPVFYTQRVRCAKREMHAVDKNLHLARMIGLPVDPPQFPLGLRDGELTAFRTRLANSSHKVTRFIAVLPGARWATKRWRTDRFVELLDRLHADGFPPAVLLRRAGGPGASGRNSCGMLGPGCKPGGTDIAPRAERGARARGTGRLSRLGAHAHRGRAREAHCGHFWPDQPGANGAILPVRASGSAPAAMRPVLPAPLPPRAS